MALEKSLEYSGIFFLLFCGHRDIFTHYTALFLVAFLLQLHVA